MLWIDNFYMFQFITCMIALTETTIVHHFARSGNEGLALRVDLVFRILMPFAIYPVCVIGLVLWAFFHSPALGIPIVVCGVVLPIVAGVLRVIKIQRRSLFDKEVQPPPRSMTSIVHQRNRAVIIRLCTVIQNRSL